MTQRNERKNDMDDNDEILIRSVVLQRSTGMPQKRKRRNATGGRKDTPKREEKTRQSKQARLPKPKKRASQSSGDSSPTPPPNQQPTPAPQRPSQPSRSTTKHCLPLLRPARSSRLHHSRCHSRCSQGSRSRRHSHSMIPHSRHLQQQARLSPPPNLPQHSYSRLPHCKPRTKQPHH